jgi:PAS domain S-box-containing protein
MSHCDINQGVRLRNAKRWGPAGVKPYVVAMFAVTIAFSIRYALQPVLGDNLPFVCFTIAALLTEFFVGLRPALLVSAIGLVSGTCYFVPPFKSFVLPEAQDLIFIGGYLSVTLLGIILIEALQRAKHEARLFGDVAQSHLEMLESSDAGRTRAEGLARQHEDRFQSLASTLPHVWYMRRLDGNFEYANDEFYRCTGLAPGSLVGDGWLKSIHPDDVARTKAAWSRVIETGKEDFSELRLRMIDDSYRVFEGQLSCINDKRGKIIRWIGVAAESPTSTARAIVS